jgi:hypothetical protein
MAKGRPRIGAYVLAADPTWLRSSLARYYERLDVLLVSASTTNRGWTGRPVAADQCLALVESVDTRGIARVIRGEWIDRAHPMTADTAQRQAAITELGEDVDWILQVDSDELLPSVDDLFSVLAQAEARGIHAVEWPMRVLFRRLRDGRYLEVIGSSGAAHYEYPGPVAVRPGVTLVDARRTDGRFLRPIVTGDTESPQIIRAAASDEVRLETLDDRIAIVHNSWARSPRAVRGKIASWSHSAGVRSRFYYFGTWLPTPLRWRRMHDFHPFAPALWPRLGVYDGDLEVLLHPAERA